MANPRVVCQFSCGAASAVATKLALAQYSATHEVVIVNAFIQEEHADNRRFLADCERWFGQPVTVLREDKHGASTLEVFRRRRFMKGPHGAPCSKTLKRDLLDTFARPGDVSVFGFTAEESFRFAEYRDSRPGQAIVAPLIERQLGKSDVLAMVARAGIELPLMYRLGYRNANCVGCVKGGQGYWQAIRADFPEQFEATARVQEDIGVGAGFLRFRSGPRKDQRMSLRDLPAGPGDRSEDLPECSIFCAAAEAAIQEAA